ncbi:alpha-tectorin-like [Anoplopoma fimbria]|uniref:alpha-tectorin-like n=1 Tax=Anoplopoma fimbria TaxID=229290 RepID=UPI0023EBEDDB|nr:alpha-tectorin-like [Anoplopoma fimbria]
MKPGALLLLLADVLAVGSTISSPNNCSMKTCTPNTDMVEASTCGPTDVCLGNNTCGSPPSFVCTVTGSTVIDFHSRVHSVQDRCDYVLMTPTNDTSIGLVAGFRERRRKDVSFLANLMIMLPNGFISLQQGGRVLVSSQSQTLTLNTTTLLVHGVELSKDQTGVIARMPFSNMTVFFDGNTAHVTGPMEAVDGLCGNPSNQSQTTPLGAMQRILPGCNIQHNDTVDGTINCNRSTEHCALLRQPPFTACHSSIDPEPYVDACINTTCNYPEVDGLKCQFFEAYAKACNLRDNITLGAWKSAVNCSADPQAFCQDQYCSDHEFCGGNPGLERCYCRALFASKYKPTGALGEPTVCVQSSATVDLAGCLLQDKGIDYSTLHLNDPNCKGHMDNQTHMVSFSFDSSSTCGTKVTSNSSQILYKNTIRTLNISTSSIITRHDQVQIDFSCLYTKPDIKSVSFRIKDSSVVQQIVSGVWNYTLMMSAYTDANRMDLVSPSTEVQLNQKIWLQLKTEGLDGNMVVIVTDSCWATNQPAPDSSLKYNLIINGCSNPADQTVMMQGNGQGTSNVFSFNMFEFSGESSEIYLHCKLDLCPKQGNTCAPTQQKHKPLGLSTLRERLRVELLV